MASSTSLQNRIKELNSSLNKLSKEASSKRSPLEKKIKDLEAKKKELLASDDQHIAETKAKLEELKANDASPEDISFTESVLDSFQRIRIDDEAIFNRKLAGPTKELEALNKKYKQQEDAIRKEIASLTEQYNKARRAEYVSKYVNSGRARDLNRVYVEEGGTCNGMFGYGGEFRDVYVISYSYSWNLETKGSSQARQRQTIYPFRMAQSDLNVTLQFLDRQDLLDFGKFARGYHRAVTSSAGRVGGGVPNLNFKMSFDGRNFNYDVALPSIPIVQSNDSVAPTMNLKLRILRDMSGDMNSVSDIAASKSYGTVASATKANSSDVKTKGDSGFKSITTSKSR